MNWTAKLKTLILLCLLCCLSCRAGAKPNICWDGWMSAYSGSTKIGYQHMVVVRDQLNGNDVYRMYTSIGMLVDLKHPGARQNGVASMTVDAQFRPLQATLKRTWISPTNGVTRQRTETTYVTFKPKKILCRTVKSGGVEKRLVRVPPGVDFRANYAFEFGVTTLGVGKKLRTYCLDASDLAIKPTTITGLRRETVQIHGAAYHTTVVEDRIPSQRVIVWRSGNGEHIKEQWQSGVILIKAEREDAMTGLGLDAKPWAAKHVPPP